MFLNRYYELGRQMAFQNMIKTADTGHKLQGAAAGHLIPIYVGLAGTGLFAGGRALERKLTDPVERARLEKAVAKEMPLQKGVSTYTDASSFLTSGYDPVAKKVHVGPEPTPSLLAHELGHASGRGMLGGRTVQGASRLLGNFGVPISLIAQAFTDPDSTTTKALQYGPGIAMAPALAEEIRASALAVKALKRAGGKGAMLKGLLSLVPAFATYGLTASAPIWGGKIVQHIANRS